MSVQISDPGCATALTQMQAAERELAMYAAIIGHRPTVESPTSDAEPTQTSPAAVQAEAGQHPTISLHTFHLDSAELKHWVSGWVKQMSQQAKRRIGEAKMRLAG